MPVDQPAIGILFLFAFIQWLVIYAMHERIAQLEDDNRRKAASYPQAQPGTLRDQNSRSLQAVSGSDQTGDGRPGRNHALLQSYSAITIFGHHLPGGHEQQD